MDSTVSQEAVDALVHHWMAWGRSCGPADRTQVEEGLQQLHLLGRRSSSGHPGRGGRWHGRVVWFDSPGAAVNAALDYEERAKAPNGVGPTAGWGDRQKRALIGFRPSDRFEREVRRAHRAQSLSASEEQRPKQIEERVGGAIGVPVNQIAGHLRRELDLRDAGNTRAGVTMFRSSPVGQSWSGLPTDRPQNLPAGRIHAPWFAAIAYLRNIE